MPRNPLERRKPTLRARVRLFRKNVNRILRATPRALAHPIRTARILSGKQLSEAQMLDSWMGNKEISVRMGKSSARNLSRNANQLGWTPRYYTVRRRFMESVRDPANPSKHIVEPRAIEVKGKYKGWIPRISDPMGKATSAVMYEYSADGRFRRKVKLDEKKARVRWNDAEMKRRPKKAA